MRSRVHSRCTGTSLRENSCIRARPVALAFRRGERSEIVPQALLYQGTTSVVPYTGVNRAGFSRWGQCVVGQASVLEQPNSCRQASPPVRCTTGHYLCFRQGHDRVFGRARPSFRKGTTEFSEGHDFSRAVHRGQ